MVQMNRTEDGHSRYIAAMMASPHQGGSIELLPYVAGACPYRSGVVGPTVVPEWAATPDGLGQLWGGALSLFSLRAVGLPLRGRCLNGRHRTPDGLMRRPAEVALSTRPAGMVTRNVFQCPWLASSRMSPRATVTRCLATSAESYEKIWKENFPLLGIPILV